MEDEGHSDEKPKKCGALRGGFSALILRVGRRLGKGFMTPSIVSAGRSHLGLLGWCQIRGVCKQPLALIIELPLFIRLILLG